MYDHVAELLKSGGIGVLATDTLYGVIGSATSKEAVERIYKLKGRDEQKPFIILIEKFEDVEKFNVVLDSKLKKILENIWPGKVTVILPCKDEEGTFKYLHRDTCNLAFRVPDKESLKVLIHKVGPLVAPSANLQGQPPAQTIDEAKEYFKNNIDFYEDEGTITSLPSTIVSFMNGELKLVRKGAVDIQKLG